MSEKVKITRKQADRLRETITYGDKSTLIQTIANTPKYELESYNQCLATLSLDELIRALYIGYEVEKKFKPKDWIYIDAKGTHNNKPMVAQIDFIIPPRLQLDNVWHIFMSSSHIRHATEEEIAQEKKRRFWSGIGRDVDEYRTGDIVYDEDKEAMEVINVRDVYLDFKGFSPCKIEKCTLICPVEKRLDGVTI
ncbi:hypothetical protein [Gracilibacillus saliphilus]|uniref:hypothetical protein n=1 Tax=Gracilibacillus saliphilus TaxID=543890 RepID=UPI0013D88357|nr:hypothetical protein [Gracilibacillus saliphilus]